MAKGISVREWKSILRDYTNTTTKKGSKTGALEGTILKTEILPVRAIHLQNNLSIGELPK